MVPCFVAPRQWGGLLINPSGRTSQKSPNPSGATSHCVAPPQLGGRRTFPKPPTPSGATPHCVAPSQLGVALWRPYQIPVGGTTAAGGAGPGPTAVVPHPPLPWRQMLIRVYGKQFGDGFRRAPAWGMKALACGNMALCKKPDLAKMPPPEKPQCAHISAGSCRGGWAGANCPYPPDSLQVPPATTGHPPGVSLFAQPLRALCLVHWRRR